VTNTKVDEPATLIAKLAELHGRAIEISRRMSQDASLLAELQQEMSVPLKTLGLPEGGASASRAPYRPQDATNRRGLETRVNSYAPVRLGKYLTTYGE